ncbi:uncharacterized protein TrAtP1_007513 [Trichoderma atroviride]|uniref:uncharacterized protein n=1 Tax=Hypocrea atroviridis TaxID=63577 RepID=UPI00332CCF8C|nr:hypothetical protein TrAtP1_007513 [Trichoderma atroviride]
MHQSEKEYNEETKEQSAKRPKSKELPAIPDVPETDGSSEDDSTEDSSSVASPPGRPMTRARAVAGKGQLPSPASSKRSTSGKSSGKPSPRGSTSSTSSTSPKRSKSPKSSQSSSSSSQSTPSPIRRIRRIVQPPRDPNKPTWLELKFAHNKGVKRTRGNAQRPANATPIKDRGLRASLE